MCSRLLGGRPCLLSLQSTQVLPKVYGGNAELVPAEEAALKRLMQHERKQSKQAAKCKALKAEAARSSRIASAGRAVSRWSSSAWGVAKKPAVVRHYVMLFAWSLALQGVPKQNAFRVPSSAIAQVCPV